MLIYAHPHIQIYGNYMFFLDGRTIGRFPCDNKGLHNIINQKSLCYLSFSSI